MHLSKDGYFLRSFSQEDLNDVFLGLSNPVVTKHYGVHYDTIEVTERQLDWFREIEENKTGLWRAIISASENSFCGAIGFNNRSSVHRRAEIGFWLLPSFWGKGIIRKLLPEVLHYGFETMRFHRIQAEVESENLASAKVLLSAGFKLEGRMHECEMKNGKFIDLDLYAVLQRDVR